MEPLADVTQTVRQTSACSMCTRIRPVRAVRGPSCRAVSVLLFPWRPTDGRPARVRQRSRVRRPRRLSMDEAVRLALEQNLGIQIERINPQIQDVGIAQARSSWVPIVTSTLTNNSTNNPSTSVFSGGQDQVTDASVRDRARHQPDAADRSELLGGLGQLACDLDEHLQHFDPLLRSNVTFSVVAAAPSQLQDRRGPSAARNRAGRIARRRTCSCGRRSSLTTRNVKNAYWDLAYPHREPARAARSRSTWRSASSPTTRNGSRSARWRPSTSSRRSRRSRATTNR